VGADRFTTFTPTFFIGRAFGDLPDSAGWLRAFAVTGQIGYAIRAAARPRLLGLIRTPATKRSTSSLTRRFLTWADRCSTACPTSNPTSSTGLADFINHLIPIVEFSLQTPVPIPSRPGR